jgi:hypothetical protein
LRWLASLNATSYDVVRGDLSTLRTSGGDFSVAADQCLANDTTATQLSLTDDPAPGQGDWFLVRGGAGHAAFTWNSPSPGGQVGNRDPELAAAPAGCQ